MEGRNCNQTHNKRWQWVAERCGGQEECPELEFQIGATPTKGFLYYLSKDDTWHYSSEHFQRGGGGGGGLFPPPFWCSGQLLRDKKRKRGRNAERDTAIILVSSTTMLGRSFVHSWLQSVATREDERRRAPLSHRRKGRKVHLSALSLLLFFTSPPRD